ncbi:MAG: prepilin peptidase [Patescibacteria group bacterium]
MFTILSVFFFLFGLILGSFFNVIILRLVREKNILGRSRCLDCGIQLKWYDNIPLLSFIFLKGKCRYCARPISWQYPLVELASGLLWLVGYLVIARSVSDEAILTFGQGITSPVFGWAAMTPEQWLAVMTFGIFSSILLILFVFDLRWYILPDIITIPAIVVALIINLMLGKDWLWLIISAVAGAVWFLLQYVLSRGKWVGSGDIRLGALIGAMLGSWQGLLIALFLAYLSGSVVAMVLVAIKKKGWKSQLPFGAFLTIATVITLLWGTQLWDWYLGLLW